MQIKSLFLVAAAAVSVLGFTVPERQPEGVYIVYSHENGTEIHKRIAEPYTRRITKRWPYFLQFEPNDAKISCGHRGSELYPELNHADADAANADIDRQCGPGAMIASGYNFYAIRGDVVSYICNQSWDNQFCEAGTRDHLYRMMAVYCGSYIPGEVAIPWKRLSYGYNFAKSKFCGTGP